MTRLGPLALLLTTMSACSQTNVHEMNADHPLNCDPNSGTCTLPGAHDPMAITAQPVLPVADHPLTIQYFTDPICSSCWGIEPQLRRLKAEYGSVVHIEYHMGGLLPGWEGFNGGGISKPSDVASHWDEVSQHYRMPIIGDVWLEDPLASSYPPSIAFKAAELQDKQGALAFLRRMREMVFMEKRNIARREVILEAAAETGLDTARLSRDLDGAGPALFQADLALARATGVRGFPTMIVSHASGDRRTVYGSRPYSELVSTLEQLYSGMTLTARPASVEDLFKLHPTWCAQEAAVMLDLSQTEAIQKLDTLAEYGHLERSSTRNGSIWRKVR